MEILDCFEVGGLDDSNGEKEEDLSEANILASLKPFNFLKVTLKQTYFFHFLVVETLLG